MSVNVEVQRLSDLIPDSQNANKGTERGLWQLRRSVEKHGAGRSGLLDMHGRIIAGNKTAEVLSELGFEEVIVVATDGSTPVFVQRTDVDLNTAEGRELAYADNRVGQTDLMWDAEQIARDQLAGIDLSDLWRQEELDALLADLGASDSSVDAAGDGIEGIEEMDVLETCDRTYVLITIPRERLGDVVLALEAFEGDESVDVKVSAQ